MDWSDSGVAFASVQQTATAALANWMLKATPFPALVITETAHVLYANALARDVLNAGDGLESRHGVLRFQHDEDQTRFDRVVGRVGNSPDAQDAVVFRLERPSGKRALALTILQAESAAPGPPMWIVFISDTNERIVLQPQWIEAMFDVTRGEARVLALVSAGMSAEDIGATLRIATATVRVHLRNVYRKLKLNRQSDLVATILRSIMPMCACEAARNATLERPMDSAMSARESA